MHCYHVPATNGLTYGVAATTKRDALIFVQHRIETDGGIAAPMSATDVGTCDWSYGNVLCYGPTS